MSPRTYDPNNRAHLILCCCKIGRIPTEISDIKIILEPLNITITGLSPQYPVGSKIVAEEEKTVGMEGYFTELPISGTYVVNVVLYYTDQYSDQQTLSEQLLVKMEDTARNCFYQGETAYKSEDCETALEQFRKAKEMYVIGNYDV